MNLQAITDESFQAEVLSSDEPVVVDFWAPWCGPCRTLAPRIEALAETYAGRVRFAQLNVDENPETAARYGVMSIPTLLFVKGGEVRERLVGVQPGERLQRAVENLLD
jgi:thioredoxin 1